LKRSGTYAVRVRSLAPMPYARESPSATYRPVVGAAALATFDNEAERRATSASVSREERKARGMTLTLVVAHQVIDSLRAMP
jgi:hypothetical protein